MTSRLANDEVVQSIVKSFLAYTNLLCIPIHLRQWLIADVSICCTKLWYDENNLMCVVKRLLNDFVLRSSAELELID
jgi:hypothetical protein